MNIDAKIVEIVSTRRRDCGDIYALFKNYFEGINHFQPLPVLCIDNPREVPLVSVIFHKIEWRSNNRNLFVSLHTIYFNNDLSIISNFLGQLVETFDASQKHNFIQQLDTILVKAQVLWGLEAILNIQGAIVESAEFGYFAVGENISSFCKDKNPFTTAFVSLINVSKVAVRNFLTDVVVFMTLFSTRKSRFYRINL